MDNGVLVTSSAEYTREALCWKWGRWLVFIICGLPMALIPFVFDSRKFSDPAHFSWEMIPWGQLAALILAGFLLSFILSGYLARIYRGSPTPPEFDSWGSLYIDGIKIAITGFLWFVPVIVLFCALVGVIIAGLSDTPLLPGIAALVLMVIIALALIAVCIIAVLYSIPGVVRCARAGSIREGIRFSAITGTLRSIGWVNYIVALIVLGAVALLFCIVVCLFSLNEYTGAVASLVLTPLYTIFSARYITQVYDTAAPVPVPPEQPAA